MPRRPPTSPYWTTLLQIASASRHLTALLGISILVGAGVPTLLTLVTGAALNAVQPAIAAGLGSEEGFRLLALLGFLAALFVAQQSLSLFRQALADRAGRRLMATAYRRSMVATLSSPTLSFLEESRVRDCVARTQIVGRVGPWGAVKGVVAQATTVVRVSASALLLAYFSVVAAMLMVSVSALAFHRSRGKYRDHLDPVLRRDHSLRRPEYLVQLASAPSSAKDLRIYDLKDWLQERYRQVASGSMRAVQTKRRSATGRMLIDLTLVFVVEVVLITLIARSAIHGSMSLGGVIVYLESIRVIGSIHAALDDDFSVQEGARPLAAVLELETLQRRAAPTPIGSRLGERNSSPEMAPTLQLDRVSFWHQEESSPTLQEINLLIPPGSTVAVVGKNGAGKTTLTRLLCGLYQPQEGRITADGREINLVEWRKNVAVVFQDFIRYPFSVRENIALGAVCHSADSSIIDRAADAVGLLATIEALPQAWDTLLSADLRGGVDLSSGQWQRIAIARALYAVACGATVLILDEATSHMDPSAELLFLDRFIGRSWFDALGVPSPTMVITSHRFSAIRRADSIVVLDSGRVVEYGGHDDLLAEDGQYAQLFRTQQSAFFGAG